MKSLKYRAICPQCNNVFDSRYGKLLLGKLVCPDCGPTKYNTWLSYSSNDKCDKEGNIKSKEIKQYPDFIPKDWRDCYQLPIHLTPYYSFAMDKNSTPALSNFNIKYDNRGDYVKGEEERIKKIVAIINGEIESDFDPDWSISENDSVEIQYKGEYQFLVRGWRHLTGCGAMSLPIKIAEKMQDGFITYIINRLNGAKNY